MALFIFIVIAIVGELLVFFVVRPSVRPSVWLLVALVCDMAANQIVMLVIVIFLLLYFYCLTYIYMHIFYCFCYCYCFIWFCFIGDRSLGAFIPFRFARHLASGKYECSLDLDLVLFLFCCDSLRFPRRQHWNVATPLSVAHIIISLFG